MRAKKIGPDSLASYRARARRQSHRGVAANSLLPSARSFNLLRKIAKMDGNNLKLNPTNGHIVAGTNIDGNRFLGRVKAAQLFQIAPDPRDAENRKKVDASKELQDLQGI